MLPLLTRKIVFLAFICLLYNLPFVLSRCDDLNKYFLIKSQVSGYVIEVQTDDFITIQSPSPSSDYQQWLLEPSSTLGLFNILSKSNGKALAAASTLNANGNVAAVLTTNVDNLYQQWFINSEGSIINAAYKNYALDIRNGWIQEGEQIILWDRYDNDNYDNEKFVLQY